ncbi:MAG: nucleoside hydrolase [Phototrophicaceae bacterium]
MKQKMWIDTDMGSDDAVALIMALKSDKVDVVGISALSGNVPLEQAALNARFVAELCDSDVPVYAGADKPLLRPYVDATWFHGVDGLSGYGGTPKQLPETTHAVDALISASHYYENLVLVTLGPLTNIALAVARDPSIVSKISRCVVMGGAACTYGNVTPAAEYNIWVDPDAARTVFLSGLPIEMVGWEFCQGDFALDKSEMEHVRSLGTALAHFTLDCNEVAIQAYYKQTQHHGLSFPDPVTMAIALDKSIATETSRHYVEIEIQSELTRGTTLVDKLNAAEDARNKHTWAQAIKAGKNVEVTWNVDSPRWKQMLYELLV